MRRILLHLVAPLLSFCVLFLLLVTEPGQSGSQEELLELSVILRESAGTAQAAARQGMEQAAADMGAELRFLTLGGDNQAEEQRLLLAREVSGGADGILLIPADREALAEDVRLASESTVIVTLETDMRDSGAAAWFGVDNVLLGESLGQAALNGVSEGGTVALLDSVPGVTGITQRLEAAAAVLEAEGRQVVVCGLEDIPARAGAVVAFEAAALEQAAEALQAMEEPPLLYGMGSTAEIAARLEQGHITAITAQNEFAVGYLAVEAAVRAARRETTAAVEPMESFVIRMETMYEPENQKLLFPVTR